MVSDLQNADKENFLKKKQIHMFIILFSIFCSGIPDLTVGILKMLIPLYFSRYMTTSSLIICPRCDNGLQLVCQHKYMHSKCLLFTNISYVQEHFELNNRDSTSAYDRRRVRIVF